MTSIGNWRGLVFAGTLVALTGSGCTSGDAAERGVGTATFTLTQAPPDVSCVQISAVGSRSVSRVFPVAGASSATLALAGLPTGDVVFSGAAYPESCGAVGTSSTPAWVADPVSAVVVSSPPVVVTLHFRRNGQAIAIADFVDCGNGARELDEQCDDGNLGSGDGCSNACLVEPEYQCSGEPSVCAPIVIACGDGIVDPSEPCDDGNLAAGDGCSDACAVEAGFQCSGQPTSCTAVCGDGLVRSGEQCDDGSPFPGDGCSAACTVEPGYQCQGEPSACTPGGLVVNEVDYDTVGIDTAEFVEVYNAGLQPADLSGISLVLVNGVGGVVYRTIPLQEAGSLAPGEYLVVATPGTFFGGARSIAFPLLQDNVQNGPDAVALVDAAWQVIDALSYEGSTSAQLPTGLVSLVEGTPTTAADGSFTPGSLARLPNGSDTNDAAVDWVLSTNPTPGMPNTP